MEVEGFAGQLGGLALQERGEIDAVNMLVGHHWKAGEPEDGWEEISAHDGLGEALAGFDFLGIADEERHADAPS